MEDNTTDIATKQLTSYKCTFCGSWLSIPPVMTVFDDGSGGIGRQCGRCKHIKCTISLRNIIFENVAKYLKFPCIYENCKEIIPWKEVDTHEKRCPYKKIKCPVYYEDCEEQIEISQFKSHMQMMHKKNVYFKEIVVDMINAVSTQVCLLIVDSLQFLILLSEDQICTTSLQSTDKNYCYYLRFSSFVNPSISVIYENIAINDYYERESCFTCLLKTCTMRIHPNAKKNTHGTERNNSENTPNTSFSIPENIVQAIPINRRNKFEGPTCIVNNMGVNAPVYCSDRKEKRSSDNTFPSATINQNIINFNWKNVSSIVGNHILVNLKVTPTTNQEVFLEELEAVDNNEHIKKTLECPICTKYMTKEIYSCEIGHLFCKECKSKVTLCPSCQAPIGCIRNYALESMAENVNVPCKNKDKGCVFVGKLHMLSRHEDNCSHNAQ